MDSTTFKRVNVLNISTVMMGYYVWQIKKSKEEIFCNLVGLQDYIKEISNEINPLIMPAKKQKGL